MGKELRAVGYCRTSGKGQKDNTSIPSQRDAIERFCKSNGWNLVHVYVDECRSGAKTEGRDDFNRMVASCVAGEVDVVVPFDATRFARDGVDVVETGRRLKALGVAVVDSKGGLDTRDHRNALKNFLYAGVSEHERLTILERMLTGRIARAKAGLPWAGNPPFGREFRRTGKNAGTWHVSPKGEAVRALLERYVGGESLRLLFKEYGFANQSHVQNLVHRGQLAARPFKVRFHTPEIGIDETVEVPAVPPVISEELEQRVKDRFLHNRKWNRRVNKYRLAGFLRCGHCGAALTGGTTVSSAGNPCVHYKHHQYAAGGGKGCGFRQAPASLFEAQVLDYLYRWFIDRPAYDLAVKLALPSAEERQAREGEAGALRRELEQAEREIDNLVEAVAKGADPSLLVGKQQELKARRDALLKRLDALEGEISLLPDLEALRAEADAVRLVLAREHTGKDWRQESYEDLQRFLHFLFSDNPKRNGLGVFLANRDGAWSVEVKARLRLGETFLSSPPGGEFGEDATLDVGVSCDLDRDSRKPMKVCNPEVLLAGAFGVA